MIQSYLLGLGWIAGLLLAHLTWGWVLILGFCLIGAGWCRRDRRLILTWAITGMVALLAMGYLQLRQPVAGPRDVSRLEPGTQTVMGHVQSLPRPTRAGRYQFWLRAEAAAGQPVTGRLYVTYPETSPRITPGQTLALTGFLYRPSRAENPGGFDFAQFLAQRGAFAGLSAQQVEVIDMGPGWGGWALRSRVVQTFQRALGERHGSLLSGMVLGANASPVDFAVRDAFRTVGLSHVLAASGFHVAILVGVILGATETRQPRTRQIITLAFLVAYVCLTGGSPSVLRASLMASSAVLLLGRASKYTLSPVGLLLLVAVLLLGVNPLWIGDLGFQLSFVATLGLLVSARPCAERLSVLPKALADAASIPLAALLWTLPLQLTVFGQVSVYAVLANVLTLPLVSAAIIGGFIAAALSLISPALGYFATLPLTLLVTPLDNWVQWLASWPNPVLYTGVISGWHCALLYGALGLSCLSRWRWRYPLAIASLVIVLLTWFWPFQPPRVVALAEAPVLILRSGGETTLINSGDAEAVERVVIPYLRYHGLGKVDRAIALNPSANGGWDTLAATLPLQRVWGAPGEPLVANTAIPGKLPLLVRSDQTLEVAIAKRTWILAGDTPLQGAASVYGLWWDGQASPQVQAELGLIGDGFRRRTQADPRSTAQIWNTGLHGAVEWTPQGVRTRSPSEAF